MNEEIKKVEPVILSGFMELLPAEQMVFNQMLDAIRETYELFGFIPLDTPLIEKAEILLAKGGGETDKQIYRFQKGDNDLALRFDLTIPLARYVAQHYADLQFPFRRYHIGKVYRGERPQKGRYREFYQCDIDIIGDGHLGIINDAEIPSVIYATFRRLGFKSFTIRVNNRKILTGFFNSQGVDEKQVNVLPIIDKLEKIGQEGVKKDLCGLGLSQEAIEKIFAFINIKGKNNDIIEQLRNLDIKNDLFIAGVNELDTMMKAVSRFEVPEANLSVDLTIARGLDYYTGTVYETFLDDHPEIGSVCSGGRFDNLAGCYTNKNLPGVGISIGLTRLFSQLLEAKIVNLGNSTPAQVIVIPLDGYLDNAIATASKFRQKGIPTTVYLEQSKPAKVLKYANRLKIPFSIIIGGDEVSEGIVSLKDMTSGEQRKLTIEEAISVIHRRKMVDHE